MGETMGKSALLGQLRDAKFSEMVVNRLGQLMSAFGDNIPQFMALEKGALEAAYCRLHPGTKGLGARTYDAFEAMRRIYKQSLFDKRQMQAEAAKVAEEAERRRQEEETSVLNADIDFELLTSAMAALGTMKLTHAPLRKIMDMYALAKSAQQP